MDSKSNTATLLSSSKSRNYNFRSGGGNTTRYIVGSIGRACRAHTRKNSQHHQHLSNHSNGSVGQQRHQNVAIATQVINPSAIGGSLKNRRFVEHFGPREDDQISFLSRRRRTVFGKACWYIVSIAVTLMMVTGLILAVGYLQSEKQRISTRPVKLAQGQSYDSLIIGSTTTTKPPIFPIPAIHPPKDSAEEEADDMDEIGVEDYLDELGLQSLEKDTMFPHNSQKVSVSPEEIPRSSSPDSYSYSRKDEEETKTNEINSSENDLTEEDDDNKISSDKGKDAGTSDNVDNGNSASTPSSNSNEDLEKSHEEVKVYNGFGGLSFEFPIYRANNKESSSNNKNQNQSLAYSSDTANSANDHETKESQNSSSNFTSLLDSDENETEYEHEEEALSDTDDDEKNYANASQLEQTNNKKDLSIQSGTKTIQKQQDQSNNETNADSDATTTTITDTNQQLVNNSSHNNHDFKTTSSSVKLQTDLFDNNEELADFETSASEEFLENERYPSHRNQKLQHNHNEHNRLPPPPHFNKQHDSHSFRSSQSNRNNRNRNNNNNSFNNNGNRDDPSNTKSLSSSIEIIDSLGDDDELEKPPVTSRPPPPNRNDPRKLSLRPPSHYDRNKSKLNPPKISPSKDLDKVLLLDDPPREAITSTTSTSAPPKQTDNPPILEYKVDFSKILSSTATTEAPPSTDPERFNDLNKLIAQLPPGAANPYPSFKFDFSPTTVTASSSSGNGNDGNGADTNLNLHVPSATTDFNLNLAQLQPYSSSQTLSNTIPGSSGDSSGADGSFDAFSNPANQFSKRTFNNFDSSASGSSISNKANTNSNPFAYLLGSQSSTTGVFGSPSSTGATLNLFQPHLQQSSFNFDTSASNPQGSFNIPSGIVPVDLSASHISVNGGSSPSSSSDLPYPNLDTTGSYSQPNKFSFNSYDISNTGSNNYGFGSGNNNDVPILTTRNGLVPNYNTITQGINLLKLLSPIPQNQNGGDGGFSYDDQHSIGSSNFPTYSYSPQVDFSKSDTQFPSFTSSSSGNSGGSGHGFLDFWKWKNSGQDLHSSPSEISSTKVLPPPTQSQSNPGFDPRSAFRTIDTSDDLTSSGSSFSKAIISKAHDIKNTKLLSSKISSTTSEPTLLSLTSKNKSDDKTLNSQPRSLSISILPKPVSSFIDALTKRPATFNKRKPSSSSSSTGELDESLLPKSRKRIPQNYEAEEHNPTSATSSPNSETSSVTEQDEDLTTTKATKRHPGLRLKSGFFT